jgi:hypothetical protein
MGKNDVRQSALHFEAVKVSMSQDKNGIILRLNVHPNDCPKELHTDWVGSRYIIAMVKLTDDDKPDVRPEQVMIQKLISSCGLLCRNEEFYEYLCDNYIGEFTTDPDEMERLCVDAVRRYCNIKSRSEFNSDAAARRKFEELRDGFAQWRKMRA